MKRARTADAAPGATATLPQLTVTAHHAKGTDAYRRQGPHAYDETDAAAQFWLREVLVRTPPAKLFTDWRFVCDRARRTWWREACHSLLEWHHPAPDGRDARIEFFDYDEHGEPCHKYEIDGEPTPPAWKSVTTVLHDAFPHFDRQDACIKALDSRKETTKRKYAVEKRLHEIQAEHRRMRQVKLTRADVLATGRPEFRQMRPAEMFAEWDRKSAKASGHGTDMHFNLECHLNGLPHCRTYPEWDLYVRWKATHPTWRPYRTEKCTFDEALQTGGQYDNSWFDPADPTLPDGRPAVLYMTDWKFSEEIKLENEYESGTAFFTADLPSCNGSIYGLQQPLYQLLEERHSHGQRFASRAIVVLHRRQADYIEIPLPYEEDRMAQLVAWRHATLGAYAAHRNLVKIVTTIVDMGLDGDARTQRARDERLHAQGEDKGGELPPEHPLVTYRAPARQAAFERLVQLLGREEVLFDPALFPIDQ